ncbi:conserved hypothetical protein [Neospora caninum Liverpool]|uniref:Transmembrane protein n=1 Tax=Neospora caninum (strain Liverpool) TaxID=572307 RepID=F0V7B4_NEOCL|nr:conserved hypothetical protein [Neospora caninum Liverpool]CBZ49605.1 conserved hypothetical protein [Neospora caninum Liverpool]|eukprot:XP_003879640.1 conserved hypothetical protein [Neospora caninum Liverpool]
MAPPESRQFARREAPAPLRRHTLLILLTLALLIVDDCASVRALKISSLISRRLSSPAEPSTAGPPPDEAETWPHQYDGTLSRRKEAGKHGSSGSETSQGITGEDGVLAKDEGGRAPPIDEAYLRQQADLLLRCEDTGTPFPLASGVDARAVEALHAQVKAGDRGVDAEHTPTRDLADLANMYYEEVATQLRRHKREALTHGWDAGTPRHSQDPQDEETSQLCWKLRPALPAPGKTSFAQGISRMLHRLGLVFRRAFRGTRVVRAKIKNWFQRRMKGKEGGTRKDSKALQFLKRLASLVQQKVAILAKRIVGHIVRCLPAILLGFNIFLVATASITVAASPASPLAILSLVASIIGFLSFAVSKGIELNRQAFTQGFSSRLQTSHFQTFGLVWAQLRAEETVQVDMTAAAMTGTRDAKNDGDVAPERRNEDPKEPQPWTEINEAFIGAREMADGQTVVAENIDADAQWVKAARVPAGEPGAVPPSPAALEEVRSKMRDNLTKRKASVVLRKHLEGMKTSWREKRFAGLGKILTASLRMVFDAFNFAVSLLLRAFGSAWAFVVDVAIRKAISFFRMLKTFQAIAAFFEKFQSILRWLFGRGRFFYDFVDPYRNLISFAFSNRVLLSQLANGTLMLTSSSGLFFVGTFLWVVSKPLWSWYLTKQGMVDASLLEQAQRDLAEDAIAYKSFLLGAAAFRPKTAGEAPFVFPNVSETQLVEIIFIMNFLDMYKVPNLPDASVLSNTTPSQSFLLFQRIRTLDEFRAQLSPGNRTLFEETFSTLKTWDSTKSLHIVHSVLTRNIQHCALQYGEAAFRREIETRYREMALKKKASPQDFPWFIHLTAKKRQMFSKRVFNALKRHPNSVSNPVHIKRAVTGALGAVTKQLLTEKMSTWAGALVHHAAVNVMGSQLVLQLYKDEYQVVDRTSLRVSNVPVDLYPFRDDLEATLEELFVFDPAAQVLAVRKERDVQVNLERFFLAEDVAGLRALGAMSDHSRSSGLKCESSRPTVLAFPEIKEAAVTFVSEARECNHAATAYFLKMQVDRQFMADVGRGIFKRDPGSCAPFRTSALEALDILADQVATADAWQLPNTAQKILDVVVDEHPAVASVYYKFSRQIVSDAERQTPEGMFKLIQAVRNFVREDERFRVTATFLKQSSYARFRTEVNDTIDAPVLALIHKIISKYSTFSVAALEAYVYERLGGMVIEFEGEAETALWQGVRAHFARDFTKIMQSFRSPHERVKLGMPLKQDQVRFQTFPKTVGISLQAMAFMYMQSNAEVTAALTGVMSSVLSKARVAARTADLPPDILAECPVCQTVQKLFQHLRNKETVIKDGSDEENTVLGMVDKIAETYEKQANSLGVYFRWGDWFPQRHNCVRWTEDQIRFVKLQLASAVKPLRRRKRGWASFFSRLMHQWTARKSATTGVAEDLVESIREMNLYGVEGFDFRLGLRYAYKQFISEKFQEEATEAWDYAEQQMIHGEPHTQSTAANGGV